MRMASSRRVTPRAVASPVKNLRVQDIFDERLRGEIVDLGRAMLSERRHQRQLVEQVAAHQGQAVLDVIDPLEGDGAASGGAAR